MKRKNASASVVFKEIDVELEAARFGVVEGGI